MKLKSISGVVCYVTDLDKTAAFYEAVGMRLGTREPGMLTVYINWFWITFKEAGKEEKTEFQKEANADNKGAGQYLYIKIDNADEAYQELLSKGIKAVKEPRDWPWGNREFVLRDPDGYKLVFFQKLK